MLERYKLPRHALKQLILNQLTAHPSENKGLLEFTVWVIKLHVSDKNIPQNNAQGLATWHSQVHTPVKIISGYKGRGNRGNLFIMFFFKVSIAISLF